jgi:hypothetical protein
MKSKNNFNITNFVISLMTLGSTSTSKEIADFLQRKGHQVSAASIAAIKANITRSRKS